MKEKGVIVYCLVDGAGFQKGASLQGIATPQVQLLHQGLVDQFIPFPVRHLKDGQVEKEPIQENQENEQLDK